MSHSANASKPDSTTTSKEKTSETSKQAAKTTTIANQTAIDCQDLWDRGVRTDGVYTLKPLGFKALNAWCQFDDTNGWTVIQKRYDGSVNFYRGWADYKSGFGDLEGEYWLGNEKIFSLTRSNTQLSIYLMRFDGYEATANYSAFWISNELDNYRLSIGGYTGNSGNDSLAYSDGYPFITGDRDIDPISDRCAIDYKGTWWYHGDNCTYANLNGLYSDSINGNVTNMWWSSSWSGGNTTPLRRTTMMLARK